MRRAVSWAHTVCFLQARTCHVCSTATEMPLSVPASACPPVTTSSVQGTVTHLLRSVSCSCLGLLPGFGGPEIHFGSWLEGSSGDGGMWKYRAGPVGWPGRSSSRSVIYSTYQSDAGPAAGDSACVKAMRSNYAFQQTRDALRQGTRSECAATLIFSGKNQSYASSCMQRTGHFWHQHAATGGGTNLARAGIDIHIVKCSYVAAHDYRRNATRWQKSTCDSYVDK
jgi:hypothetical protein